MFKINDFVKYKNDTYIIWSTSTTIKEWIESDGTFKTTSEQFVRLMKIGELKTKYTFEPILSTEISHI